MIHRILLASIGYLSLATCTNQTIPKSESNTSQTEVNQTKNNQNSNTVKNKSGELEMSVGLPPDAEAIEISKREKMEADTNKSGIIYFKEGENKFLKEYEMNVTFKKISEDSRCPTDVNCIWEGVAVAEIELMGLATRPFIIKLSTANDKLKGYVKTQEFNGYGISLVEVTPQTTSQKGFKNLAGSYKIGLKFTKGDTDTGITTK